VIAPPYAGRAVLALFCGYEFDCVKYLRAGYDGLLLGGGVFNGHIAGLILRAMAAGDEKAAEAHHMKNTHR
jgi:dihydrodipicolinate synthase/N-acetylneuraminate lyase